MPSYHISTWEANGYVMGFRRIQPANPTLILEQAPTPASPATHSSPRYVPVSRKNLAPSHRLPTFTHSREPLGSLIHKLPLNTLTPTNFFCLSHFFGFSIPQHQTRPQRPTPNAHLSTAIVPGDHHEHQVCKIE